MNTTVFTVNLEKPGLTETLGIYRTKEEARKRAKEYKKEAKDIKFKEVKNESSDSRTVVFTDKESSIVIAINKVETTITKEVAKQKPRKLSPYIKFCNENRERIVKENPKASFTDVARITGKEWTMLKKEKDKDKEKD